MAGEGRDRMSAGCVAARRAVALGLSVGLLASCGTGGTSDPETGPDRSTAPPPASRAETTDHGQPHGRLPRLPETRDASALADQLDRAAATLHRRGASATRIREAGEFQQLAVHTLATSSGAFRRKVTARLRPETARTARSDVRAARMLRALNDPQPTMPPWRIVEPPAAGELRGYYREAQRRTGVPWAYLAAIHLVETRMGRIRGTSTAGARGPMQFLPSTWDLYGAGGDIDDPRDAVLAAARLLKDNGAPDDMAGALYGYNPSDNYVQAVTEHARTMRRSELAYRGYWHWRVLYQHTRGTYLLPVGYPDVRPTLLPGD